MKTETLYLAGGCFWCIESAFLDFHGVEKATSGYIGGSEETANYSDVCTGQTGHREAVKVDYFPSQTNIEELLNRFFQYVDPYNSEGQFADIGFQYTTAIYFQTREEYEQITQFIENKRFKKEIATSVIEFSTFYEAEEKHQNYASKCPFRYNLYFKSSGRENYVIQNK